MKRLLLFCLLPVAVVALLAMCPTGNVTPDRALMDLSGPVKTCLTVSDKMFPSGETDTSFVESHFNQWGYLTYRAKGFIDDDTMDISEALAIDYTRTGVSHRDVRWGKQVWLFRNPQGYITYIGYGSHHTDVTDFCDYYFIDGRLINTTNNSFNGKFRSLQSYFYDSNGRVIASTDTCLRSTDDSSFKYVTYYTYKKFDRYGNWTLRTATVHGRDYIRRYNAARRRYEWTLLSNTDYTITEHRTITYYY